MTKAIKAQASQPNYELHTLGWKTFQDLCITIAGEVLGQTVQTFLPTYDGGRDGAFHGWWKPRDKAGVEGSFVIQCKYTNVSRGSITLSLLEDELDKARRLAQKGLADNYLLMTNHRLSGKAEEQIRKSFMSVEKINYFDILGRDWITLKIRESARLRMLVPRVYGLGDLSQILDERAYLQARQLLESIGEDLTKFVPTAPYRFSAQALLEFGFVLLLGEPASGKSTIAASLALGAIDSWQCSTLKIESADEFRTHWNPNEPRQFFWVDDAFGVTQYQRDSVDAWNRTFPHMKAAIDKGARVLFTSRDYIYQSARSDLKLTAFPLVHQSQVVIDVQNLTIKEKEQILYNHIKRGNQSREFKKAIKPFLPKVAASDRFLPEVARRLGNLMFTKNLRLRDHLILQFVEKPVDFLREVIQSLDRKNRAALILIYMRGGNVVSPIQLSEKEKETMSLLGGSASDLREALSSMRGSLARFAQLGSIYRWVFKHPTIGDALGSIVSEDPELIDVYLSGADTRKMLREITCGELGIRGVKLIIPESRYSFIIDKLTKLGDTSVIASFLAERCDKAFLRLFSNRCPVIIVDLCNSGGPTVDYPEVRAVLKLYQAGFLEESQRTAFVSRVSNLTCEMTVADFLTNAKFRDVFKEEEFNELKRRIRKKVLPNLEDIIEDQVWISSPDIDPNEYFQPLRETLKAYSDEFTDGESVSMILVGIERLGIEVGRLNEQIEKDGEYYEYWEDYMELEDWITERSIFDDVDL